MRGTLSLTTANQGNVTRSSRPPSPLAGLTERHNQMLSEVFGIQTVAELRSNKYFAVTGALVALGDKI